MLCKVMNEPIIPFVTFNMHFAGDCVPELPSPIGVENVALYSHILTH
jgi:hypothetical protein